MDGFTAFLVCLISLTTTLILFFFTSYSAKSPFTIISNSQPLFQNHEILKNQTHSCGLDLFNGTWIHEIPTTPSVSAAYTNVSCPMIPTKRDFFMHGRKDKEFLQWRWKPKGSCGDNNKLLPRFDPKSFLTIVKGKKMGFIGDSVARNQVDSLICLLYHVEMPVDVYKDRKDRFRTWYFPRHNFTLIILWTKFLITGNERGKNGYPTGVFDLHLDRVDPNWSRNFTTLGLDYAIVSTSQWYFKKHYLYENNQLLGCIQCENEPNITGFRVSFAIGRALRSTLRYINECNGGCKKDMVTFVRTISPSHFEDGAWNTGGHCNRTRPITAEVAAERIRREDDRNGLEWDVRNVQVKETERATKEGDKGRKFEVLDVTWAMLMRPDGHPSSYWRDKKKNNNNGFNDCVHWCMPGPIDTWNDLLSSILIKEVEFV